MTNTGKVVFQTTDYLNNWPNNDLGVSGTTQVYYYIIKTTTNETKMGSITVLKQNESAIINIDIMSFFLAVMLLARREWCSCA